ncbi:MAG: serpin family protein [Planctomycetes bacterium]|jgi:serpin B|nr:serpin family protein [Planctomycetota bacterium]
MSRHPLLAAPALFVALLVVAPAAGEDPPPATDFAGGSNAFSAGLFRALAEEPGNLFVSPFSAAVALAMVREGARGETATQMDAVLHTTGPAGEALAVLSKALAPGLIPEGRGEERTEIPAFALSIANRAWVQEGLAIEAAYEKRLAGCFEAPVGRIDFRETAAARAAINDWVFEKTAERIKDIVPEGLPTADTLLALANAIHFKASWAEPFDEEWTKEGPFTPAAGEPVTARFMNRTARLSYAEADGAQILEIPYRGGETSMVVVLPKSKDGLPALIAALTGERLKGWIDALAGKRVAASLPKFTFTSSFDLGGRLAALGMKDAFSARDADFTGITTAEPLFIGPVLHKAFVAVDEAGTEAAAATVVMMLKGAAPRTEEPTPFVADHPFLFLIRHRATGAILFIGRVADPTKG